MTILMVYLFFYIKLITLELNTLIQFKKNKHEKFYLKSYNNKINGT